MKKNIMILCFGLFLMVSCSSIEADAKKSAELSCKMLKEPNDDKKMLILEELKEFTAKMDKKYKSDEDAKAFAKALKDLGPCK